MAVCSKLHEEVDAVCIMEKSVELDHVGVMHRMLDPYFVAQLFYHLLSVFRL